MLLEAAPNTEAARTRERRRRSFWAVLTNIGSRLLALVAVFLSARIALPDLGPERFGIWMTVASYLVILSFLDLGISNGLVSRVARSSAKEGGELNLLIARGMWLTTLVGLATFAITSAAIHVMPVDMLFKDIPRHLEPEARDALYAFCGLFALSMPIQIGHKVYSGLQEAYTSNIVNLLAGMATCLSLLAMQGGGYSITTYIFATFGFSTLSGVFLLARLWHRELLSIAAVARVKATEAFPLMRAGGLFLALQLGVMLGWGIDQSFIAATVGATEVAAYSIAARIFLIISQPVSIMNAPLWAAYAEAKQRGDARYIETTFKRSLGLSIVVPVLASMGLVFCGPILWRILTSGELPYPAVLIGAFAAWCVVECIGNALAMFMNGLHLVREQVVAVVLLVSLALPLKLVALRFGNVDVIPALNAVSYLAGVGFTYGVLYRERIVRSARQLTIE